MFNKNIQESHVKNFCIGLGGLIFILFLCSSDTTWGSPVDAHAGDDDAFAAKLNNSGVLLWNTFMGSTDSDEGQNIAVGNNGIVYVTGSSYIDWGSPINMNAGSFDAFAVKFDYSNVGAYKIDFDLPTEYMLSQNYPNPFNSTTTIEFVLPYSQLVTLKIYNIFGEEVLNLVSENSMLEDIYICGMLLQCPLVYIFTE